MAKISIIAIMLVALMAIMPTQGEPAGWNVPHSITTTIQTDGSGNCSESRTILGELQGVIYLNGNFTGAGNVTVEYQGIELDDYNFTLGDAYRLPGVAIVGSTDAWRPYTLASKIWMNMTGQQANKSASVYLIYR